MKFNYEKASFRLLLIVLIVTIFCCSIANKSNQTSFSRMNNFPQRNSIFQNDVESNENDLEQLNEWYSNKSYSIAILPLPSMTMNQLETNDHLKFISLSTDVSGNRWFAKKGFYSSLHSFGYANHLEKEFETYREEVTLNWIFRESLMKVPDTIDYVFITSYFNHENMTLVQMNLHKQISLLEEMKDICFVELNKKSSQYKSIISVNYPDIQFHGIAGMLLPQESLRGIKRMIYSSHYLNSIDIIAQHYCEVENKQIVLNPLFSFIPFDL